MTPPLAALVDVSFAYSRATGKILDAASLVINEGESVCLMGPSGTGKSTVLSLLAGLSKPQEGVVFRTGDDIWRGRRSARHASQAVTWIMQTANVVPGMTALENAMLESMCRGTPRIASEKLAAGHLRSLGMSEFLSRPARLLSGGQAQRVAVARALSADSSLILADEPTGQLDVATTGLVVKALTSRRQTGTSVVIASHDAQVANACDRVVRIVEGRLSV